MILKDFKSNGKSDVRYIRRVDISDLESKEYVWRHWTMIRISQETARDASPAHINYASGGLPVIRRWTDNNVSKRWAAHINYFYFESPEDALICKLRWP